MLIECESFKEHNFSGLKQLFSIKVREVSGMAIRLIIHPREYVDIGMVKCCLVHNTKDAQLINIEDHKGITHQFWIHKK